MLRPIWLTYFTAPTEAGEPEPEPQPSTGSLHYEYFRNRRIRRWKAFKPKDKDAN
jgi:hypothetical protein